MALPLKPYSSEGLIICIIIENSVERFAIYSALLSEPKVRY